MRYLFSQVSGNSTLRVIVENFQVKEGTIYATKIGQFSHWNSEGKEIYTACPHVSFIAGGGPWTMTEYTGDLI